MLGKDPSCHPPTPPELQILPHLFSWYVTMLAVPWCQCWGLNLGRCSDQASILLTELGLLLASK